jgi:hypothetical protein
MNTRPRLEPPLPTVSSLPPLKRSIDAEYGNSVALPGGEIAQLHRQIKPDRDTVRDFGLFMADRGRAVAASS